MTALARTVAVLAALAAVNVVAHRTRLPADLVVPAGVAATALGARASGLSWNEMGLDRRAMGRELPAAAAAAALTIAAVGAASVHPVAASLPADIRHPTSSAARRAALSTIPLSVALPEEIAFRGVLDASLGRHLSPRAAGLAGALAFGAWHVFGARPLGPGPRGRLLGAIGTVAATAVAGLGFSALRRRTGSLLPGVAVHWALNGSAAVAAAGARPARRRA